MNDDVVVIDGLVKFYDGRCVINDIGLRIPHGCIYGLLGRNGIGKTTIIRILLGLDYPTRGKTSLLGKDSKQLSPRTRSTIGYVAEGHNMISSYKIDRLIRICRELSARWNDKLFNHLLEMFRLPTDRLVRELSIGMRAELNLALAMATDPQLLILDDPTLGLDTVARRQFLELAVDLLQKDGRTILFCSHILSDVERIADRIGILAGGKLVVDCSLEELKKRIKKLRLIFPEKTPDSLYLTEIINQQVSGREMTITVVNMNEKKQAIINTFGAESCEEIPMSLEDIFIECTRPKQSQAEQII